MTRRQSVGSSLFLLGGALFPLSQTSLFAPYVAVLWILGIVVCTAAGIVATGGQPKTRRAEPPR